MAYMLSSDFIICIFSSTIRADILTDFYLFIYVLLDKETLNEKITTLEQTFSHFMVCSLARLSETTILMTF